MFTNIADIKRANKDAGRYWFSPDTLRAFGSRVESRIYDTGRNTRVWVESTRNYDDSGREYKISEFDVATGDISYVSVEYRTLRFDAKVDAVKFLESNLL